MPQAASNLIEDLSVSWQTLELPSKQSWQPRLYLHSTLRPVKKERKEKNRTGIMPSTKPTILIVHGAWHQPSSYDKLTAALRSAGYEVHIPKLTSADGSSPPSGDLVTDTAQIRAAAERLIHADHTVVALLHSYGGQVGTNALSGLGSETRATRGLIGGVARLIYLCAFILPEGWSTYAHRQAVEGSGEKGMLQEQLIIALQEDGNTMAGDPRGQFINGISDEAEAAVYISTLGPWNLRSMTQPLSSCAWKEIPVTYVHATKDKVVTLASQQLMVKRVRERGLEDLSIVTLETDHCPHLSATEEVVGIVNKAAEAI